MSLKLQSVSTLSSWEIKMQVKYFRTPTGKNQDTMTVKSNITSVKLCLKLGIVHVVFLHDLRSPEDLWISTSLVLPSTTHRACLLGSGWLHSHICCHPWWVSHCTGISKMLHCIYTGLSRLTYPGLSISTLPLPRAANPQLPLRTISVLELLL